MVYCAIYARVSTDRQAESVEHQVSLLTEFARSRGAQWQIDPRFVYEDTGVSATKHSIWSRPAMRRLLADAQRGHFSVVLFKGISRFARNTQEALDVLDRLKARGLRVVSYEENYDSHQENSNFMFTMHAAIAEYEAEKIGVRVRLGNKEKAKTGRFVGGTPPDGYVIGPDGRLAVDEARRPLIERIYRMYVADGLSCGEIARRLNSCATFTRAGGPWHPGAVARILRNDAYGGTLVYNRCRDRTVRDYESEESGKKKEVREANQPSEWVVVQGAHEPIIAREWREEAMRRLHRREPRAHAPRARHALTGLLVCGGCGRTMVCQGRTVGGRTYRYYVCRTAHREGRSACPQRSLAAAALEEYIADKVEQRLRASLRPRVLAALIVRAEDEGVILQRQLQAARRRLEKWRELPALDVGQGEVQDAQDVLEAWRAARRHAEDDVARLTQRLEAVVGEESAADVRQAFNEALRLAGGEQTLPFADSIRRFVRRITVRGEGLHLEYTFVFSSPCSPRIDGHV